MHVCKTSGFIPATDWNHIDHNLHGNYLSMYLLLFQQQRQCNLLISENNKTGFYVTSKKSFLCICTTSGSVPRMDKVSITVHVFEPNPRARRFIYCHKYLYIWKLDKCKWDMEQRTSIIFSNRYVTTYCIKLYVIVKLNRFIHT